MHGRSVLGHVASDPQQRGLRSREKGHVTRTSSLLPSFVPAPNYWTRSLRVTSTSFPNLPRVLRDFCRLSSHTLRSRRGYGGNGGNGLAGESVARLRHTGAARCSVCVGPMEVASPSTMHDTMHDGWERLKSGRTGCVAHASCATVGKTRILTPQTGTI